MLLELPIMLALFYMPTGNDDDEGEFQLAAVQVEDDFEGASFVREEQDAHPQVPPDVPVHNEGHGQVEAWQPRGFLLLPVQAVRVRLLPRGHARIHSHTAATRKFVPRPELQ